MDVEEQNDSCLLQLPNEILVKILMSTHLQWSDVYSSLFACKRLREICHRNDIWRQKFFQRQSWGPFHNHILRTISTQGYSRRYPVAPFRFFFVSARSAIITWYIINTINDMLSRNKVPKIDVSRLVGFVFCLLSFVVQGTSLALKGQ